MNPPRRIRAYLLWSRDDGFLSVSLHRASVRGPRDREYKVVIRVGQRLVAKPHMREHVSPLKRELKPRKPKPREPSHAVTNIPRPALGPPKAGGIQMPLKEWNTHVKRRRLLNVDGYGRCVVNGKEIKGRIRPSTAHKILPGTTHINWYPAFHNLTK